MSGIVGLSYMNFNEQEREQKTKEFIQDLFWSVYFLQHLKKGYGGLSTVSGKGGEKLILLRTHKGPFKETFEKDLIGFQAPLGIGCTTSQTREPYLVEKSSFPKFTIGFSGNIINREEILEEFIRKGHAFERQDDVVVISRLIAQAGYKENKTLDENFLQALNFVAEKIRGSCTLVILTTEKVYAFRSLDGHKQMSIGKRKDAVLVASELPYIDNQGFVFDRELKAGELVSLKNGACETVGFIKLKKKLFGIAVKEKKIIPQPCIFDSVYFGNPPSLNFGITNVEFRQGLGAALAKKDIAKGFIPDVIIPVPDSGRFPALGYYLEFRRQYLAGNIKKLPIHLELLIKYGFTRSFTLDEEVERYTAGEKKIIPAVEINLHLREKWAELILMIIEDSLVRGTQILSNLLPKVNILGFKEVHIRFSYSKIVSPCLYGKSTKEYKELAAVDLKTNKIKSDEEIAKVLTMASCGFNYPEDLAEVAGVSINSFCYDCAKQF